MPERKPTRKSTAKRPPRSEPAAGKLTGFTDEEREAMRERTREIKAARDPRAATASDEDAVLAKISAMPEPDRAIAQRLHELVRANAPALVPRLWYGMPAYSGEAGVVCFFQAAQKFRTRYATLGFSDKARLDDGDMWPTVFAILEWTPAVEARVVKLLKQALTL